jgi:predicted enzyme related to lactoylglutathione lyase
MSDSSSLPPQHTPRAQPESLRGRSLWVTLTVNDLQKSLAFYRDVVGFTVHQEHVRDGEVRAVSLKAGDVRILIGQDDGAKGWDRKKGQGISMQLMTAQNVDQIAARIKERGGTLESEPMDMPWGARVFRVQDPDGFILAISSEPPTG